MPPGQDLPRKGEGTPSPAVLSWEPPPTLALGFRNSQSRMCRGRWQAKEERLLLVSKLATGWRCWGQSLAHSACLAHENANRHFNDTNTKENTYTAVT
jgi:hypothetical protein